MQCDGPSSPWSMHRFRTHASAYAGWQLHEEVALAAFACGQHHVGGEILKKLQKQFKDSSRVECLRGMAYESTGDLDRAESIYDAVLVLKPTFPDAMKRKVCVLWWMKLLNLPSGLRHTVTSPHINF